jgi:hypothetical protein
MYRYVPKLPERVADEQLARLDKAIAEIAAESPPDPSSRGKLLRSLQAKRRELAP